MIRKEKLEELKSYIEEFKTIKCEKIDSNNLKTKLQKVYKIFKNEPINKTFIQIDRSKYYLNNGKNIIREKIVKNGSDGSAAIVLPVTKDKNTLLIVEPRVFTKLGVGVGFPAGYIEIGEKPINAAKRELTEETGYVTSDEDIYHLVSFYQDEGCSSAYNHIFLAKNCEKKESQHLDDGEFIKYFECTFEEALELQNLGYITGSNSIIALEKSKSLIYK